jgi:transcriptional regulator with XRE-family HTH domain
MRDHEALIVIDRGEGIGASPLRAIREHLGLTREAVARLVGMDAKCLAICEEYTGIARPDSRFRLALARCLGVSPDLLFEPRRHGA